MRDQFALRFVTAKGNGWTQTVEEQSNSPMYGRKENHNVLHFATNAKLPAEYETLIISGVGARLGEHGLTKITADPSIAAYRYQSAHSSTHSSTHNEHCIFFSDGKPWKLEGWSSDAEFLYWGPGATASRRTLICCKGTYVEWSGYSIVTAKRTVLRCEVIESGNQFELISSDPDAVVINREGWTTLLGKDSPELAGKLTSEEKS